MNNGLANEKFLKVKGNLVNVQTKTFISDYSIKVILDDLDSNEFHFDSKFDLWLPANRTAKLYFIKDGFAKIHFLVDASFIPSFAYKKKQTIELNVKMTPDNLVKDYSKLTKPFCTANFKSSETKFILSYPKDPSKKVKPPFTPPFRAPYITFKGAKLSNRNLDINSLFNSTKSEKSSPYSKLIQGIIFSNLNYCIYNEHIQKANELLITLAEIDKNEWANIKAFDSPEYGQIVMKTLNSQKTRDTLFTLGCWVGTSQILLQSFTTNSKVILHGKKLIGLMKKYKGTGLTTEQNKIVASIKILANNYNTVIDSYMAAIKNKTPFKLIDNEAFIALRQENLSIFKSITD
jgi:hypothetical protein